MLFFTNDNIYKSNDAHYCDTMKRKNLQKEGQICKNIESWFYEKWLFQEERPIEENQTFMKNKLYFHRLLMGIVYRDAYLQFNRNKNGRSPKSVSFFLETNIYKIHSQQNLLIKRIDSLSCHYLEN